jgi:nitrogen fixation-related uncharacterized protein
MDNCGNNNNIFDSNNTNINPVTINVDNKIISPGSEENQPFYILFKMNKLYLFSIILLLTTVLGILIFFIGRNNKQIKDEIKMKNAVLEDQENQNKTCKLWIDRVKQRDAQIELLEYQIGELKQEKSKIIITIIFYLKLPKATVQLY